MTDEKTIDLLEVDAVEYAASIGHAAAGQLYYVLSGREKGFRGDWVGCNPSEEEELEQRIYELANYVAERDAGGARLWHKARIDGVIVEDLPESLQFVDAPRGRRWAFDMFATVSLHAFLQISRTQKAAKDAAAVADIEDPGLKLEDSIFEREQPLDYMEPHAKQFLQDEAELGRQKAAADAAAETEEHAPAPISAGGAIVVGGQPAPALSVGMQQGNQNAQDTADQGQGQGDQEGADPDAQGEVSEVADSGDGEQEDEPSSSPPVPGENGEAAELETQVEDADRDDGDAQNEPPAPVKPAKAKSSN